MVSLLITVAVFIIVLGIMILVHEFGHFIVAKKLNVKVLEFNLGMGPRIFGFRRGETEYMLKAFPIGGSVKMLGEEPGETDEEKIDAAELKRAFFVQPPHKRIAITVAGPLLNVALAVIIAPLIYIIGIEVPGYLQQKPMIHSVDEGGPAATAGFQHGDLILTADGEPVQNWEELLHLIALNPGKEVKFNLLRDGKQIELAMTIGQNPKDDSGQAGIEPAGTNIVGSFSDESPARDSGLMLGDEIVAINDAKIGSFADIVKSVRSSDGKPLTIKVLRAGAERSYTITPVYSDMLEAYAIGISPNVLVRYSLLRSIGEGMKFLYSRMALTLKALKNIFTGRMGRKALGGPIEIAYQVGFMAKMGFTHLLNITALIGIMLGIFNLFPFPALDGGHIIFACAELVSRRRLNQKFIDVVNQVGLIMLFALIIFVTGQDIFRHWEGIKEFFLNRG